MPATELDALMQELAGLLQAGAHDGDLDSDKEIWEQDSPSIQKVWRRITHPSNREALKTKLGTAKKPEWNRLYQEALRQAIERAGA